jgi:tripeptide aminopeptidase
MSIDINRFFQPVSERLMRYARINTQSQNFTGRWPTTERQRDLAKALYEELQQLGVDETHYDEQHCVVYGRLRSNLVHPCRPLGLIAHLDTAPDASGENCRPWLLRNYDGGDITLNAELGIVMKAADYPNLKNYLGQDLILTDGTTLLGGDDKASIAAIMTLLEYYRDNPDQPHGDICVAFTPDEEVGGLAQDLDFTRFGSDTAYTLDGDHLGHYMDQTFNASMAISDIKGVSVHTGTANGIMVNAVDIASQFLSMLPERERPQYTSGTEGFYHIVSCQASCEQARIVLIIRDFDKDNFLKREAYVRSCAEKLAQQYGQQFISCQITEQYANLKEVIDTVPFMIEHLKKAISDCGITPVCEPFRGGTDGSSLSYRGLPCPNLSAGYENAHGRFEYVPVQSMMKNVEILIRLAEIYSQDSGI